MRILFAVHHGSRVAGAESYVNTAIAALSARGHSVALLAERAPVPGREPVQGDECRWCAEQMGVHAALAGAAGWHPHVVYVNGLASLELERGVMRIAPSVLFAHGYAGCCISGSRTWQVSDTACSRALGPGCLFHYFPRRCGGRSPLTMARDYRLQRARQDLQRRYAAIVVASLHMAGQFTSSGLTHRVHVVPIPVPYVRDSSPRQRGSAVTMVYAGRLERLKGAHLLIAAAREACVRMGINGELRIAGEGPLWPDIEAEAFAQPSGVLRVSLVGWRNDAERDDLLKDADAVLVPSLWPEPFGLIGLEAGRFGVPAVAFSSGGIPEWLRDGVNGILATERTPHGLADAIVACLADHGVYRRLSEGAVEAARAVSPDMHAARLETIFAGATQ